MKSIIIGLGYKARHGKGTAAKAMCERWKDTFDIREYSFGGALKREVNELDNVFEFCLRNGIPYDPNPDMTDPLCQTRHGKQAKLLQWYGTEYRRKNDPYYWVKKLATQIEEDKPTIAVISDIRFRNEFYWVKSTGGFTIKCNRQGFVDLSRDPNHVSETDLDGTAFDYEITVVDGDIEELKKDALYVFDLIKEKLSPPDPDLTELV